MNNKITSRAVLLLVLLVSFPLSVSGADTYTNQLTLREAQRLALDKNEQISTIRKQVKTAREQVTQARSALLPELTLRGEQFRKKESPGGFSQFTNKEAFNWGADLVQPLYHGGKSWYGVNIRQKALKQSKLTAYRRTQEILFRVSQRFYGVVLARKTIRIAESSLKRARDQLQQARSRYEVGQVTQNAVMRARVDVAEANRQLTEAKNSYQNALEALAVEIADNKVPGRVTAPDSTPLMDAGLEQYQEMALRFRRDAQSAEKQIEETRERVKFEKADWYPDLDLRGSYDNFEHESLGLKEDWRVTLQASYPIFSGWQETSQVDEARYRYNIARQNYQRLQREIRRDVRQAHSTLTTQRSVVNSLEEQVDAARRNYQEIAAQFEEGLVDSVDVSDALTTLNESELRLANARITLRLDRLRLKLTSGIYARNLLNDQEEQKGKKYRK